MAIVAGAVGQLTLGDRGLILTDGPWSTMSRLPGSPVNPIPGMSDEEGRPPLGPEEGMARPSLYGRFEEPSLAPCRYRISHAAACSTGLIS